MAEACMAWSKRDVEAFNSIVNLATETDKDLQRDCRKAIDSLQRTVQRVARFIDVDRVVPAGSFGRRTMVRGSFDVDLLVFVNEYGGQVIDLDSDAQLRSMRYELMRLLKQEKPDGGSEGYKVEVQDGRGYQGALKLDLPISPGLPPVHVDLMLLPNMAGGNNPSAAELQYRALTRLLYERPEEYSEHPTREAALSEALMELVKGSHDQIKGVVRLLKAWYKYGLEANGVVQHVPSVLLEVVVLAASQNEAAVGQVPKTSGGNDKGKTREFVRRLTMESLRLLEAAAAEGRERVVLRPGGRWGYSWDVAHRCAHVWGRDPVVVLHPIDPTCNIAEPRPGKPAPDWETLAAEARSLRVRLSGDYAEGPQHGYTAFARAVSKLEALKAQSCRSASGPAAGSPQAAPAPVASDRIVPIGYVVGTGARSPVHPAESSSRAVFSLRSASQVGGWPGMAPDFATGPPRPDDRRPAASSMTEPTGSYAGRRFGDFAMTGLAVAGVAAAGLAAFALLAPPRPPRSRQ